MEEFVFPPFLAWLYAFISWLIYNLYRLDQAADEFDINEDGYSIDETGNYFRKNWVKITISFLLLVVGIFEMEALWKWLLPSKEFAMASYFLAGFLSVALQVLMDKYEKKK